MKLLVFKTFGHVAVQLLLFFLGGVSSFHSNVVLNARGDFMKTGSSMEQTATTKIMRANNQLSQEHEDTDEK